jgi:hypothetical protein
MVFIIFTLLSIFDRFAIPSDNMHVNVVKTCYSVTASRRQSFGDVSNQTSVSRHHGSNSRFPAPVTLTFETYVRKSFFVKITTKYRNRHYYDVTFCYCPRYPCLT